MWWGYRGNTTLFSHWIAKRSHEPNMMFECLTCGIRTHNFHWIACFKGLVITTTVKDLHIEFQFHCLSDWLNFTKSYNKSKSQKLNSFRPDIQPKSSNYPNPTKKQFNLPLALFYYQDIFIKVIYLMSQVTVSIHSFNVYIYRDGEDTVHISFVHISFWCIIVKW